jgi:hypothetical protein
VFSLADDLPTLRSSTAVGSPVCLVSAVAR